MANETTNIKSLLNKYGKVGLKTTAKQFSLIRSNGCFYYSVNGFTVGISEHKLDELIGKLPLGIKPIIYGE